MLAAAHQAVALVGVAVRDAAAPRDGLSGITVITDPAELAALAPDLVVEAAGRAAVLPWGRAALTAGADFAACVNLGSGR